MPSTVTEEYTPPRDYCAARVHASARCEESAHGAASNALDYVRGLWNLYRNSATRLRWSLGPKKPVNEVLLGPTQTLHHPDGTPAVDGHWAEAYPFRRADVSTLLIKKYAEVRKYEKKLRRAVARVSYRSDLVDLIVRYGRALDDADMAASFLKLWTVLEQLVSGRDEAYRLIPRRASFLFRDHGYHAAVLRNLQQSRNRIVHQAHTPGEAESLVYQLKEYVEWMLLFAIGSARTFRNMGEYLAFLELPREVEEIRRGLYLRRVAYRRMTGKKPAAP